MTNTSVFQVRKSYQYLFVHEAFAYSDWNLEMQTSYSYSYNELDLFSPTHITSPLRERNHQASSLTMPSEKWIGTIWTYKIFAFQGDIRNSAIWEFRGVSCDSWLATPPIFKYHLTRLITIHPSQSWQTLGFPLQMLIENNCWTHTTSMTLFTVTPHS